MLCCREHQHFLHPAFCFVKFPAFLSIFAQMSLSCGRVQCLELCLTARALLASHACTESGIANHQK